MFLYTIINILNNTQYVGKTSNYNVRKERHINDLNNNIHHCIYLQHAWNKYGSENFIFKILLSNLTKEEAYYIEYKIINENYDYLYNVSRQSSGGI